MFLNFSSFISQNEICKHFFLCILTFPFPSSVIYCGRLLYISLDIFYCSQLTEMNAGTVVDYNIQHARYCQPVNITFLSGFIMQRVSSNY